MKRAFYFLLALVILLFGLSFAYKNPQVVELNYYFNWHWSGPLPLMLLGAFLLGVGAGILASIRTVVRMQRQLAQARKEIRHVEQEVTNLRSLPIKDVL